MQRDPLEPAPPAGLAVREATHVDMSSAEYHAHDAVGASALETFRDSRRTYYARYVAKTERQRLEREGFERRAKERAEREAKERLEREAAERKAAEEAAAAEERRKEELRPDAEKLLAWGESLQAIEGPQLNSEEARKVRNSALALIQRAAEKTDDYCVDYMQAVSAG